MTMKLKSGGALPAALLLSVSLWSAGGSQAKPPAAAPAIHWQEGGVGAALAKAKRLHRPVLLYWGAKWCPACLMLQVGAFKDPAVVAEVGNFIPVHLDGDSQEARVWADRFGLIGLPRFVALSPDGLEIARTSDTSSSTGSELSRWLHAAAKPSTDVDDMLKRAAASGAVSRDEWGLLASATWADDPERFSGAEAGSRTLQRLADRAPEPYLKRRFALLAASVDCSDTVVSPDRARALAAILAPMLQSRSEVRLNRYELSHCGGDLVNSLPDERMRKDLGARLVAASEEIYGDPSLPQVDRIDSMLPEVALARRDAPGGRIPDRLSVKVKARVAQLARATTDTTARESFMPAAVLLLHAAGDDIGAERLLKAELPRTKTPYYYWHCLSLLDGWRGDGPAAVSHGRKAYLDVKAPTVRVEYAALYSMAVMKFFPKDQAQVKQSVADVVGELHDPLTLASKHSGLVLSWWSPALKTWSREHGGSGLLESVSAGLRRNCAAEGAGGSVRTECLKNVGVLSAA